MADLPSIAAMEQQPDNREFIVPYDLNQHTGHTSRAELRTT